MNLKRVFLYLLIASVAFCALVGIAVILFGTFGEFETKVLLTAATITIVSIFGLACGAYLESGRGRAIPFVGIACSLLSGALWIFLIWYGTVHEDLFVKSLMSVTLLAMSCSHLSLMLLARMDRRFAWARLAIQIAVWLLTGGLLFLIWNPDVIDHDITGRVIGVLAILVGALTVITPIFHRLSSSEADVAEIDAEMERLRLRISELEAKKASLHAEQPNV